MKIQKKNMYFFLGGGEGSGRGVPVGGGGQGGCERRIELFEKIQIKKIGGGRGSGGGQSCVGGQGGCERNGGRG